MKTVIEMAGQAFETPGTEPAFRNGFWTVTQEELERFAELVRADERARMAEQPAQQEPKQSDIFCGVDFADGMLSVSVLRRRADDVAELLHAEQIELPAQRTWVGLTDDERDDLLDTYITAEGRARAIEAKLKEKNT